jgi:hypothetical protein
MLVSFPYTHSLTLLPCLPLFPPSVGSTETVTQPMWVLDSDRKKIVQRNISYVPGLYKIFDEIMVNASDNKQRDPTMDTIKITIDQVCCCISFSFVLSF